MKKLLIVILTLTMLLCSSSCSKDEPPQKMFTSFKHDFCVELDVYYNTFEELFRSSTDVVRAKCLDVKLSDDECYIIYGFEISKRFCGEDVGNKINLYVPTFYNIGSDPPYDLTDITYEIGNEYYLVLMRYINVYNEEDQYQLVGGNIYLPADNIKNSTMYGEKFTDHSDIGKLKETQHIEDYISLLLTQRDGSERLYEGWKYIVADDIETIIKNSEYILHVKIGNTIDSTLRKHADHINCHVIASLKGDVDLNSTVKITFPAGSVTKGSEYIVALSEENVKEPRSFRFSSKKSLFSTEEADMILQYID